MSIVVTVTLLVLELRRFRDLEIQELVPKWNILETVMSLELDIEGSCKAMEDEGSRVF